jgi:hypothetical protein
MPTRRSFLARHALALVATAPLLGVPPALAQEVAPAEVQKELPGATLSGGSRMRFFGLSIYDARLWVTPGFRSTRYAQHPLALELNYLRDLSGKAIAERSLKEMERAGPIDAATAQRWLAAMAEAFPDVKTSDRITGIHQPEQGVRFWFNGQLRATIRDVEFSQRFFGIWLAQTTSEPALRSALLAGAAA